MKKPSEQIYQLACGVAAWRPDGTVEQSDKFEALMMWLDAEAERALPKPVVCPECSATGVKSRIVKKQRSNTVTALYREPKQLFDDDGREHFHDDDDRRGPASYTCSAGHTFSVESMTPCWCGWPEKKA